jgi:hypothetical protein
MDNYFPNTKLIVSLLLFAWAVCAFGYVNPYVFSAGAYDHIIDSHLQYHPFYFFDSDYVMNAARCYNKTKYLHAYYVLDLAFLFIYSYAFLLLAHAWRKKDFYRLFRFSVILCALFDFMENTSFLLYLFNTNTKFLAVLTSIFTTLKSVLFILNIGISLFAFFVPHLLRPVRVWWRFVRVKVG